MFIEDMKIKFLGNEKAKPRTWVLKGLFFFKDTKHLESFKKEIFSVYENYLGTNRITVQEGKKLDED